jgi:2-polyprenyl-6-methoxyphenol hydroxylase-like FAD-dependent oxidoreductase
LPSLERDPQASCSGISCVRAAGIECVILERQTRDYVESRIRAGVLETTTTDLLKQLGLDAGLNAHGLLEAGFNLTTDGALIRIEITQLTGKLLLSTKEDGKVVSRWEI